jgi:rod shape-determining protein MreB
MGALTQLTGLGGRDVAVDAGTANTLVYVRGRGIVLSEPSLLAVDPRSGEVRATGVDARRLLDCEDGSLTAVSPITHGAIADPEPARLFLRSLLGKVHGSRSARSSVVVVSVPCGATDVERQALEEACLAAGARRACLVEEPIAAAAGAGLPPAERAGSLVIDIGAGTSEAAVLALGEVVVSGSIRLGGDEFDEAIVRHVKRHHNVLIAKRSAEELKREIGSAIPVGDGGGVEVRGRDTGSAQARMLLLSSAEIQGALEGPLGRIIEMVKETVARTPAELYSDIVDRGMLLAGGGALLPGLAERLCEETQMPAHVAEQPSTCVAAGTGAWLERSESLDFSRAHAGNGRG